MKTLIILMITTLGTAAPVWAQSDQYKQAMTQAIGVLQTQTMQTSVADLQAVANPFERITSAETREWLPRYYAGLMYVYLGFTGKDEAAKDKYLDQADANLKVAEALSPGNDELAVLKAYIAQSRMVIDPMNRWQQYGPLAQVGIACPVLKQAAEKFATFKPANNLSPNWGQKQIEPLLAKCK